MDSKTRKYHLATTPYGFEFGDLAVERLFEHRGYVGIRIKSRKSGKFFDVQSSPSGRNVSIGKRRKP